MIYLVQTNPDPTGYPRFVQCARIAAPKSHPVPRYGLGFTGRRSSGMADHLEESGGQLPSCGQLRANHQSSYPGDIDGVGGRRGG